MKMKSILLVMLALCLTVCLCACGNDTSKDDKSPASTGASKSTGAASTTTTTTTEAAQTTTGTDSSETVNSGTTAPTAPVATQPVDGKANYTVTVTDEAGNPIPGVFVQMCLESCIPCITNAQGVASYPNMAVADYKVSFISIPEGYTSEANEYHFEKDTYEMTIVLKAN